MRRSDLKRTINEETTLTDATDDGLIEQAIAGDARAFERLYRRHSARVYGLCLRISGDPVRASELTQEAFVRAWENLGSFRGERPFEFWLRKIAVNASLVSIRSARRRGRWEVVSDDMDEHGADHDGPAAGMDLEAAIAALPAQARAVLVLHDIEGFHHEEIAEQMNIAEGTSKAHLHRARKLLREALR